MLSETVQVISGSIPETLLETKTSPENGSTVLSSSESCGKPMTAVTWDRVPWGDGGQEKPVFTEHEYWLKKLLIYFADLETKGEDKIESNCNFAPEKMC